jgi:diketogulonate reductase-like aldo/keto reductase
MDTTGTNKRLLQRREFNRLCAVLGLSPPSISALFSSVMEIPALAGNAASKREANTITFPDNTVVSALGQGTWHLAQGKHPEATEEEALRTGISLGMTVIDTAEMYSNGRSEQLVGRVIAGQRDQVFLVSKVTPDHVSGDGMARACEASLGRLGTDYLDLYLLHWRNPDTDLSKVVAGFEGLRARGKIRAWGVSNFKASDMEDLFRVQDGHRCATNQVRYSLVSRAIEYDLLPWCREHSMPLMAYSPLGNGDLADDPALAQVSAAHHCSWSAIALAWVIQRGNIIAITESGLPAHVKDNAVALSLMLASQDVQSLDAAHPLRWTDVLRFLFDRSKLWLRQIQHPL